MKGALSLAAVAVVVAVSAGCGGGSGKGDVALVGTTEPAGGTAIVLTASTDKKLAAEKGGHYALELRGISDGGSFDHPSYTDPTRCVRGNVCEWTIAPAKAGTYEYKVFLLDDTNNTVAGESSAVKLRWDAPPRPESIKLFVNGQTPPSTPLTGDHYSDFPAGPMQVEARWTTDARDTGYYVRIRVGNKVYARCSIGTTCLVRKRLPLAVGTEISWTLEVLTTQGDKVAGGFKVCLEGATKARAS